MKKGLLVITFFSILLPVFSQNLSEKLYGIWEGKDRFVFFEQFQEDENPQIVILLKEYYGWYYDRAAEPEKYSEKYARTRNAATGRKAEKVLIKDSKSLSDNAWEITLEYSKNQKNSIPVCLVDDNLFLNFLVQIDNNENLYIGNAVSKGFLISEQSIPENIPVYYFSDDSFFDIRYWKTDMDFADIEAGFKWNEIQYYVPKHIKTCNEIYTCVNGRSTRIRNIQNPQKFDDSSFMFSSDKKLLIRDNEPYLYKIADKKTFEDLMTILVAANSRRVPEPKPIFPPLDVNWHWDLIDMLEKDNVLIQQVRKRQLDFGSRSH